MNASGLRRVWARPRDRLTGPGKRGDANDLIGDYVIPSRGSETQQSLRRFVAILSCMTSGRRHFATDERNLIQPRE